MILKAIRMRNKVTGALFYVSPIEVWNGKLETKTGYRVNKDGSRMTAKDLKKFLKNH